VQWRAPRSLTTLALCAAAGDSALAAISRPFTWRADVATGAGLAGMLVIGLLTVRVTRRQAVSEPESAESPPTGRAKLSWAVLASVVGLFELVNYLGHPRSKHPTISSLLDALTGHEVLRGLLFGIWLAGGWWLWRTA
jgi:hypothetical protein